MDDLFKLHKEDEDIFPESWIGFGGAELKNIINTLVNELIKIKGNSYFSISRYISKDINLAVNAVFRYIKNKDYIPIPVISSLLFFWKTTLNKDNNDVDDVKRKIIDSVEYLKVNNSSSKRVNKIKNIDLDLSYTLGAHAADGMLSLHITFSSSNLDNLKQFANKIGSKFFNLKIGKIYFDKFKRNYAFGITLDNNTNSDFKYFLNSEKQVITRQIRVKREYRWKVADHDRDSIVNLSEKVNAIFGVNVPVKKTKESDSWEIETKNKVLFRYFEIFFNFPFGRKARIISEPLIIKKSGLELRKSFLSGGLTFDGGIDKKIGTVHFESYSKCLFESCLEIILLLGIEKVYSGSTKRGSFYISIYPKYFLKGMNLFRESSNKDIIMQRYIK